MNSMYGKHLSPQIIHRSIDGNHSHRKSGHQNKSVSSIKESIVDDASPQNYTKNNKSEKSKSPPKKQLTNIHTERSPD